MTYLAFHFVFILPIIAGFVAYFWRYPEKWPGRRAGYSLAAIAVIALVYTTAWDNYLVYRGVWGYGPERVLGTIGYVPIEEYLFFLFQPLLTGLWFLFLMSRSDASGNATPGVRVVGAFFYGALALVGLWLLMGEERGLYMGLILVWAFPVLAGQWAYAGHWIWAVRKLWLYGILIPTVYLWIADRIAIGLGIWYIEERFTFGFNPAGLPIEEATFFLVTNVLVVQGLILFMHLGKGSSSVVEEHQHDATATDIV